MIVTFQPTINNASATDPMACYMNFLRCVTAIATAAAGTTSLTVNPFTATNAIDTTKNCIISIDANAEAGGWATSASHNVIASLSNTPATYTAFATAAALLYRADFYNTTGKSTYPYKKLCFHSYTSSTTYNHWCGGSYTTPASTSVTARTSANMLITFGCSTTTDWTDLNFIPGGLANGSGRCNDQTTSYTLNANTTGAATLSNQGPGLCYTDITIQYHMAITADYCVIWESKVGDTYANGYFNTTTTGNGTTYWNQARYGSVYYMGLRETQAWEAGQANNPPWVCWQTTLDRQGTGANSTTPYSHDQVAAWLLTYTNTGILATTPRIYQTTNYYGTNNFHGGRNSAQAAYTANPASSAGNRLDGPLFQTRAMGNNAYNGETLATTMNLYMPQTDPATGTQVPGAYPIKISRCYTDDWAQGGNCRGIYKSLSMPYTTMKLFWQAGTQTFTIGGDTYLPFVINEDMWLVRFA